MFSELQYSKVGCKLLVFGKNAGATGLIFADQTRPKKKEGW